MKKILSLLIFTFLLLINCSRADQSNPQPGDPDCREHSRFELLNADESFIIDERYALTEAAVHWMTFSEKKIDFPIVFGQTGTFRVIRLLSTDQITKNKDLSESIKYGVSGYTILGWTTKSEVFLVVDRAVSFEDLQRLATHEFGHIARLVWPNCETEIRAPSFPIDGVEQRDCKHTDDVDSIMNYYAVIGVSEFNSTDLALCQANCLCP